MMIPISEKLIGMLNQQISNELSNALLYQQVASWAHQRGLKGIASFFNGEADGEKGHAGWIQDLLKNANAQLAIPAIEGKPSNFSSCEEVAQLYIEAEAKTTDDLEAIARVSDAEYCIGVQDLMQKMLSEQVEEEGSADRFANLVQIAGGDLIKLDLALR